VIYRADWVLPVAGPPLAGGWVAVEDGRIAAVGGPPAPDRGPIVTLFLGMARRIFTVVGVSCSSTDTKKPSISFASSGVMKDSPGAASVSS
jgi:hypothetical protein